MLLEPTVAQVPSITPTLACRYADRYSWISMPAASNWPNSARSA
jgi:hypothetical protein